MVRFEPFATLLFGFRLMIIQKKKTIYVCLYIWSFISFLVKLI